MINTRQVGQVFVLDLVGPLHLTNGVTELDNKVRQALAREQKNILLNLAETGKVDSSGIGQLVKSFTATAAVGGKLKLCCLPEKIYRLLAMTKLLTIFKVHETEEAALASDWAAQSPVEVEE